MIELCAALDAAEAAAWDRLGGPTNTDFRTIRALESKIDARRADSLGAAVWRAKRLARAFINEWDTTEIRLLAAHVDRDLAAFSH